MTDINCECCSGKSKERTDREYKDLLNRLSRIEGQVRGLQGMVEKEAYCTRKNSVYLNYIDKLRTDEVLPGARQFLEAAREAGIPINRIHELFPF